MIGLKTMAWIAGLAVLAGPAFTATKPEGVDPCALVSDAEVEKVLGHPAETVVRGREFCTRVIDDAVLVVAAREFASEEEARRAMADDRRRLEVERKTVAEEAGLGRYVLRATSPNSIEYLMLDEGRILNLAVAGGDAFEAGHYQGNMAPLMRTVLSRN